MLAEKVPKDYSSVSLQNSEHMCFNYEYGLVHKFDFQILILYNKTVLFGAITAIT